MKILGIETSCDETAASVVEGHGDKVSVLSNVVSSQIDIHKKYGGVVPEVAAREHVVNMLPVIDEALYKAKIDRKDARKKLGAIAVTTGPGLITSLMVGVETAKTLSFVWGLKPVAVNHIEGHIYANFIDRAKKDIQFPAVVLTVSGGHTMLVLMKGHGKYELLGDTRDDAAGEAFDKAAKLMNLGYPGGPLISKKAEKAKKNSGIELPRPMYNSPDFDFSFSGLKTALLYKIQKDKTWKKKVNEYSYEFERAVADVLTHKTIKAAKKFAVKTIMLSGGVSANRVLRSELKNATHKLGLKFVMPQLDYTTDNATMIAAAGYFKAKAKKFTPWEKLRADPGLELVKNK